MTTAILADSPAPTASDVVISAPTELLGEQIAALAARLHAATYELLVLLREFDTRTGWNTGFLSCAHWLHWRTGIDLGAAREKMRVAHALASLPRISATMQRGAISYAKVRALTRVATRTTNRRCWTSPRPEPPRKRNAWSGPGGGWMTWRPRRRRNRGTCTASSRPGWTTTAWSDSRPAHSGGWCHRPAGARGRGRSVVSRGAGCAEGRASDGRGDAGPTPSRRDWTAGRVGADIGLGSRIAGDPYQVILHVEAPTGMVAAATICRAPWRSSTARWTFPRKRRAAFAATPRWWRCVMTPTVRCSTSAARPAPSRPRSGGRSRRATEAADLRAVRHAAATRITWSTGLTAARRASTTSCCCADATTAPSTKAGSA